MLLRNETAIHTFGMRIPIDVVRYGWRGKGFANDVGNRPRPTGTACARVRDVLELPVGTIAETNAPAKAIYSHLKLYEHPCG